MQFVISKFWCDLWLFFAISIAASFGTEYKCPFHTGLFADEQNCHIFYHCEDNVAYEKFCPQGALFDGFRLECVNRHEKVTCGPQSTTTSAPTTTDPNAATECDEQACQLPYCFCSESGTKIPGGLDPKQTPQMIMITFDGALNNLNYDIYNTIFLENRTNPNGCPIRSTFFMTHDYSDYAKVQDMYSKGHEMAVASVSRRQGLEDETAEGWSGEMVTMREILKNFAKVAPEDVIGMRAPHIKPGRKAQYEVIYDYGFYWDSSMVVPPLRIPVWPYTLDYKIPHECKSGTCPTSTLPGIWELPMNVHYEDDLYQGGFCPYLDQCGFNFFSVNNILGWLKKDFHRHFDSNRAPYMISVSVNWFNTATHKKALLRFIDYTLSLPEVYYTTMTQTVEWMSDPQPLSSLKTYAPFQCGNLDREPPCKNPQSCPLVLDNTRIGVPKGAGGTRYMVTCAKCPRSYPWVFDAHGRGGKTKDTYNKIEF